MKQRFDRSLLASLCAFASVAAAAVSLSLPTGYVRTEDHNGDGRPDVWRAYDRHGQLPRWPSIPISTADRMFTSITCAAPSCVASRIATSTIGST